MNIVNIGCGPGKDECFFFVKANERSLKGSKVFLIDASPASLKSSQALYEKFFSQDCGIDFRFLNYAVSDDSDAEFLSFYIPKNEPTCGLSSLSSSHLSNHGRQEEIEEIKVRAHTAHSLFDELGLTCVDRLYVDVEGWDAKILLSIDFKKYFIPFILFEHLHLDGSFSKGELADALFKKFEESGYTTAGFHEWNVIAVLQNLYTPEWGEDLIK
jgi:FkbM family methyltransferase